VGHKISLWPAHYLPAHRRCGASDRQRPPRQRLCSNGDNGSAPG